MDITANLTTEKSLRDYNLVQRAYVDGDEHAYADLMNLYKEPLYYMLLRMTNDPVEADDLTIETFGKAFHSLKSYTPTHAFSTWLFTIATNHCIDHIRKKRLQTISLDGYSSSSEHLDSALPIPSKDDNPEESIIREQRKAMLREIVGTLKPRYRRLVEMRYFDDMPYEDIAKEMNMPLGTVKSMLFRARDLLYNILNPQKETL